MTVGIHSLERYRNPERIQNRIAEIYGAAFSRPPYSQGEEGIRVFAQRFPRHTRNDGFRCLVAEEDGRVLGFAYGFTDKPGQWWHEQVAPTMKEAGLSRWLEDAFVLNELAVVPEAQGRGVGSRLHDAILDGLPRRRALLSTHRKKTVARRMYDRRGWSVMLDGFVYPDGGDPVVIMGLDLTSDRTRRRPASRR